MAPPAAARLIMRATEKREREGRKLDKGETSGGCIIKEEEEEEEEEKGGVDEC